MEEVIGPTLIMHNENLEEQVVIHPPTPRSKPKPSPIATKSLRRANSLGLSTTNAATVAQQADSLSNESNSNNINCNGHPATCAVDGDFLKVFAAGYRKSGGSGGRSSCSSDDEEARDSGIVLEPWDQPLLQHQQQHDTRSSEDGNFLRLETTPKQQQSRQPFPSFDQLFQPNLDLLDPEILRKRPSNQQSQRRQRCRSMFYPPTPRETELDDNGSKSYDDTGSAIKDQTTSMLNSINDSRGNECISSGPSGSSTTPKSSELKPTRRSKRVASMSTGSDHRQHPFMGTHGLPPLPPLATSTSGTFNTTTATTTTTATKPQSAASDNNSSNDSNSSRDSTARRPSQPTSNDSTSSLSSNFTSTSTATIPLTRPSSPPDQHHGPYHSLVGSFGHGIPFSNMLDLATAKAENITGLYFAKQMNNQPKGSGGMEPRMSTLQGSGEQQGDGQAKERKRAVTSTGSPVMDYSYVSSTGPADQGAPPVQILDGLRIPGTPLAATTPSTSAATGTFQGAPMTPMTKGLHRRSHSASHFFHLSSLKHHSPAQFNLALCYEHGQGGVEQDLAKALYFYQQAADQGHTKASYNLGCICYNQGEISKAMAWFESAGKCGVQGLKVDAEVLSSSSSSSSSVSGGAPKGGLPILECPMPKAKILPHELEDMLMMGDHPSGPEGSAGGGPFVAYLPAILCLALLCRQGVQTREGEVILKRDPDQAVALLQRLLDRAPARMLNKLEKGHRQSSPQIVHQQPSLSSMSASGGGRSTGVAAERDPRKRASLQTIPTLQQQGRTATTASSIFSTSCPQLPLELSSSMSSSSSSCSVSTTLTGSGSGGVRVKRPSTVEDAVDDSDDDDDDDDDDESSFCLEEPRSNKVTQDSRQSSGSRARYFPNSEKDHQEEEEQHGSDVHEAWSVTLAQQLLKAWQQPRPSDQVRVTPGSASVEDDGRIQQRIVRHHLLYITNPTLGKNFYNLGVLYDLYLGHAQIAQRCYRSAYQNCRPCLLPLTPVSVQNDVFVRYTAATDGVLKQQQQQLQLAGLVTRINSAWNLGVLHAKYQEWPRAKSWFLKAQQDVLAHERIAAASVGSIAQDQRQRRGGGQSAGRGEKEMVSDLAELLMKQGGGGNGGEEAEWSSKVEGLLSLGSSGNNTSEMKQRGAAVSEKKYGEAAVVQRDMDEFKTRRRSLVNVLPSPAPGGQSNISARCGRGEPRGRSGSRTSGNDGSGALLGTKDSPGSRHAREHGLIMHLSSSSAGSSSSSKVMGGGALSAIKSGGRKKSLSSLSREVGGGGGGRNGSDGIRTDASKVAWVLRWVESNMDSPSYASSLSL
ncbi:hypothetical protein BGZ96_011520 [Linnemannia gamsii]|uniref:HCP-like protein n=1 Tax=Linnemannia gamsii TaxID=64522 RepID=A0ABQ7JS47_9FUNG|nr:hypothetical protein BGZ96_011520 [Linnemannia gamsii]